MSETTTVTILAADGHTVIDQWTVPNDPAEPDRLDTVEAKVGEHDQILTALLEPDEEAPDDPEG